MAVEVGSAYLKIIPSLKGISKAITTDLGNAGAIAEQSAKSLGTRMSGVFQGIFQGVGQAAFSRTMGLITGSLDGAIQRYDQLNQFPKVLQNLGITTEQAKKATDALSTGLQGLPTPLNEATSGVLRFVSKNNDIQKSTKYYLALNDALLSGGAPIEAQARAMEQLLQAYSRGKMDSIAWLELQETMPAQLKEIATGFGMTTDELRTGLEKGKISMDDFMNMISKLDDQGVGGMAAFSKSAKDSTGGVSTSISNMQTAITRGLTKLIDDFDKAGGTKAIQEFGKKVEQGLTTIAQGLKWFVDHPVITKLLLQITGALVALSFSAKAFTAVKGFTASFGSLTSGLKGLFSVQEEVGNINKGKTSLSPKNVLKSIASVALIITALAILAGVFGILPQSAQDTLIKGGQTLGQLAITLLPALLIFGVATFALSRFNLTMSQAKNIALSLTAVVVVIGVFTALSLAISLLPADAIVAGSKTLSILALNLMPALLIFGIATAGLGILCSIPITTIATGLLNIVIVIGAFTALAFAIGSIPLDNILIGAQALNTLAINLIPALLIFGIATLGLGAIGLIPVPLIVNGLVGLGVVIGALALLCTIAGELAQIPGLQWLIDQGGELLVKLADILGKVVGAFMGGALSSIGAGISSLLQSIADGLRPLGEAIASLPSDCGAKLTELSVGMVALTGGALGNAIGGAMSWLLGGAKTPYEAVADGINTIKNALNDFSTNIVQTFGDAMGNVGNAVNLLPAAILTAGVSINANTMLIMSQLYIAFDNGLHQVGDRVYNFTSWLGGTMHVDLFGAGSSSADSWANGFINRLNSQNFSKSLNLNINVATSGQSGLSETTLQAIKQDIRRAVAGGAI